MTEEKTNIENYTADRPVLSESEDAFQRYGFAKRIAKTIINRQNKESIVFGIFGAWGEGKTSVINFIQKEISNAGDDYIQITFNPWRFTDETALLTSFFNTLAYNIKNTFENKGAKSKKKKWYQRSDEPLKTSSENIGDLFQKYGKAAAIFGAGEALEAIGKAFSDVDIDELKKRIEKLLEENKKRIVIYIDDIDRLDKTEIHSILRLVKLTGDFSYTTYVLSFDQHMVASAIGERFGSGDKKAGDNFLEKIIQVPLNIPKAQPDSLKKFCFKLIDNALNTNNISPTEDEVRRFVYPFTTNVLPRLDTPRLAVRYGNSLSFAMPLLEAEVNIVDLMLIEALKVFYPEYYHFVRNNPTYFIEPYTKKYSSTEFDDNKKKAILKHLEELGKNLTDINKENIKELLQELFPILESVFLNYHFSSSKYDKWYLDKRIASSKYFDRYFSYAVIEGDMSDVEFESLLNDAESNEDIAIITEQIKSILNKVTASNFIHKLRSREDTIKWTSAKQLIRALCNVSESLPYKGGMIGFGNDTPFGQAAIFIYRIFINNKDEPDFFDFAKELMSYPNQFKFACEINRWFKLDKDEKLFNVQQEHELNKALVERAISEAGEESIFQKFPNQVSRLCRMWSEINKAEYDQYLSAYLDKDPSNILVVIKSSVSAIVNPTDPDLSSKTDLGKENYTVLTSINDKDLLYRKIIAITPIEELEKEKVYWVDLDSEKFSELNMLRQFLHWYKQDEKDLADDNKENTEEKTTI